MGSVQLFGKVESAIIYKLFLLLLMCTISLQAPVHAASGTAAVTILKLLYPFDPTPVRSSLSGKLAESIRSRSHTAVQPVPLHLLFIYPESFISNPVYSYFRQDFLRTLRAIYLLPVWIDLKLSFCSYDDEKRFRISPAVSVDRLTVFPKTTQPVSGNLPFPGNSTIAVVAGLPEGEHPDIIRELSACGAGIVGLPLPDLSAKERRWLFSCIKQYGGVWYHPDYLVKYSTPGKQELFAAIINTSLLRSEEDPGVSNWKTRFMQASIGPMTRIFQAASLPQLSLILQRLHGVSPVIHEVLPDISGILQKICAGYLGRNLHCPSVSGTITIDAPGVPPVTAVVSSKELVNAASSNLNRTVTIYLRIIPVPGTVPYHAVLISKEPGPELLKPAFPAFIRNNRSFYRNGYGEPPVWILRGKITSVSSFHEPPVQVLD